MSDQLMDATAEIVAAYLMHNSIPATRIGELIASVHAALSTTLAEPSAAKLTSRTPAVPPRQSITRDYIICLEDGLRFQSLKRHLGRYHGITPEQYRERWNLPDDFPMVAPDYAGRRSAIARSYGFGEMGQRRKRIQKRRPEPG